MDMTDEAADRIARRVFEQLAGAGVDEDPEESLIAVVDRLVERDGADETAKSLRELADEVASQEPGEGDDDAA